MISFYFGKPSIELELSEQIKEDLIPKLQESFKFNTN